MYPLGDRKNKPLLSADDADDEEEAWLEGFDDERGESLREWRCS